MVGATVALKRITVACCFHGLKRNKAMILHALKNVLVRAIMASAALFIQTGLIHAQSLEEPTALSEIYQDWTVSCITPSVVDEQKPLRVCEMVLELRHNESGQRVLTMALQQSEDVGLMTLIAPFGLLLSEGIEVAVDGTDLLEIGFRTCLPQGCIAVIEINQNQINVLGTGKSALVTMHDTNNQVLKIDASLLGFRAAWERLQTVLP